jgi:hypothetical protein
LATWHTAAAGKIEHGRHLKKRMIHRRKQEDEDDEQKVAVPPGKQAASHISAPP